MAPVAVPEKAARLALEIKYQRDCSGGTAIALHLPVLRELSTGLDLAIEFGVKRAASSAAILLGAKRLISFDVAATDEARSLQAAVGDRWDYRIADSRTASIPTCDLLFVDSLHTYDQVRAELVHAIQVRRYLIVHDVLTFGSVGAKGETGEQIWRYERGVSVPLAALGIRPAIDELMIRDPSWRIVQSSVLSHGLLVLERVR